MVAKHRTQIIVFSLAVLVAAIARLWAQASVLPLLRGPNGYVLFDPDSYMRWHLAERAVRGEGVRIRWIPEDNAPRGRINEWTMPMTVVGVTVVRVGGLLCGWTQDQALQRGKMVVGPLFGLLTLVALAALGWKASPALGLLWVVAFPVLGSVERSGFGNTDHHTLHGLLFVLMVAGVLAWAGNPTRIGGVIVGTAGGLALWSGGTELLTIWGLVAALAVKEALARDDSAGFWRGWWLSGLMVTLGGLLLEFWPHPFHDRLEFLSIWHVGLWAILGGLLEYLRATQKPAAQRLGVLVAVLLALATAGGLRHFDWAHLHVYQDARLQSQTAMVVESQSFGQFGIGQSLVEAVWQYGALPLCLLVVPRVWRSLSGRERWLLVVTGVFLLLTFDQKRWSDFLVVSLAMTGGLIVQRLWPGRTLLCVAVLLVATAFPWWRTLQTAEQVKRTVRQGVLSGPFATTFGLEAVSECFGRLAPGAIVLAPWDQAAVLSGMGQVRIVGSAAWSNLDGLADAYTLFTTIDESEFWKVAGARRIEFMLVRDPGGLASDIALSIIARYGERPTAQRIEQTVLWKLAGGNALQTVECPELKRLQPGWRILKLKS